MGFQVLGDFQRIGAVTFHAEVEGFDALQNEEGVEGGDATTDIAQELQAHLHDESDIGTARWRESLEGFPVREAMVGHVWFGEARELAIAPVKIAAVHDDTADARAVAAKMLGRRVDDDIGAMLKGTIQVGREGGVIDNQWNAGFLGDLTDFGEGKDVEAWIAEPFAIKSLRVGAKCRAEVLGIVSVDEGYLDAEFREGVVEEVVRSAVKLRDGDDVVAGAGDIEDGGRDGGLARRMREPTRTAFEGGDTLLEDVGGRIHNPRINITQLLEAEKIGRMFRVAELVTGGLVDRDSARPGRRVGFLASVEGFGSEFHKVRRLISDDFKNKTSDLRTMTALSVASRGAVTSRPRWLIFPI